MKTIRLLALSLLLANALHAATTIDVSGTVAVPQVRRFGIGGISHYYYDRVLLKNLIWRNAGFEGLLFRSIVRCASGTATGCLDDNPYTQWPAGFWDGGEFEFVLGAAKGRTGTIATFVTAPRDQVTGSTFTFAAAGTAPAAGDIFIARKYTPGGADMGWNVQALGGATVATEFSDLPPGTDGRQCIRLQASGAGQNVSLQSPFGAHAGSNFVLLNGAYRVSFKAKAAGGANNVGVMVNRGSTTFVNTTLPLTQSWATYTVDFTAAEAASIPPAFVVLSFRAMQSEVLLDDVSLHQTNGDPANTTAFRDPVVAALRELNPGGMRSHVLDLGDSLEDLLAPPFGRRRAEYSVYATNKGTMPYGFHEFLELCEILGAEPYLDIPVTFNDAEAAGLIEYLAGPVSTPYGARRAARGHPAPWTDSFPRIHLEYGNEAWNPVFRGGTMPPESFGRRGHDFFGVMRASPWYSSKFNLILGVQAANPFNSRVTHNASANHDMLAIGPYMATRIDDFASNEQLFGGLFAEASWWSSANGQPMTGPVRQTYDFINATPRPVPLVVYEVNLHTTQGAITQPVLDSFTPSIGAGLAVVDHMLIMLREFRIRDQFLFSLGGYRFNREDGKTVLVWAATRDMGVTDRKRPQYLAVKLANEVLRGDMVQVAQSGDNPRWSQPLTNRIALDNIPYIQSFAFVSGTQRSVIVFNLHRTDSLQVNFSGANAPAGSVTIKQLTSANITDTNESAETVVVTTQNVSSFDPAQNVTLPPFSMTVFSGQQSGAPLVAKGDVNGNGNVTALDTSVVLQSVVGTAALTARERCAADYDGNGSVGAFDASLILQCIVGSRACSGGTCS